MRFRLKVNLRTALKAEAFGAGGFAARLSGCALSPSGLSLSVPILFPPCKASPCTAHSVCEPGNGKPREAARLEQPKQPSMVAPWLRLAGQFNRSPLGRLSVRRSRPLLPYPLSSALFLQKSAPVSSGLLAVFIKLASSLYKSSALIPAAPGAAIFRAQNSEGTGKESRG